MNTEQKAVKFERNNDLITIKQGYEGNATKDGIFIDDSAAIKVSFFRIVKWKLSKNPQKKEKDSDTYVPTVIKNETLFDMKDDMIVWLGHASFFIILDGKRFLIDPVFSNIPFVKRRIDVPCDLSNIKNIDYLLISHNHRDHLDRSSIKTIKNAKALAPLGMSTLLKSMNTTLSIEEAGWYQQYRTDKNGPQVFFMPAQHWSGRSTVDTNKMLWGSFIIKGKKKCIYFAGDTGYNSHFKEIQKFFPEIDISLIPIGAYKPAYIMQHVHLSPSEAVAACNDLKSTILIPMHYGTYDLSDEPPGEPVRLMKKLEAEKQIHGTLMMLDVGEIYSIK